MTTYTLRPNGTNAIAASRVTTYGGAASAHAALSDNSDTTYVRRTTSGAPMLVLDLTTATISGDVAVVLPAYRRKSGSASAISTLRYAIGRVVNGALVKTPYVSASFKTTTISTVVPSLVSVGQQLDVQGQPWTQSAIDALLLVLDDPADASTAYLTATYLYETYVYVYTLARPTTTPSIVTTSPVTSTSFPQFSIAVNAVVEQWQKDNGDAFTDCELVVKLFDAATYGAGGFDPQTSTPLEAATLAVAVNAYIDGSTASSVSALWQPSSPLPASGTFRLYAYAKRDIASGVFGAASYVQFTMNITPPSPPALTVTEDSGDGAVDIATTYTVPGGHADPRVTVERSNDDGVSWHAVPGLDRAVGGSTSLGGVDYWMARGVTVKYRARLETSLSGSPIASAWSSLDTATVPVDGWWLKTLDRPDLNIGHAAITLGDEARFVDVGIHRPIDAEYAVVVSGVPGGWDGSLLIRGRDASDIAAIEALLDYDGPVYVEEPWGESRWVRLVDMKRQRGGFTGAPRTLFPVSYVEVEAP